MGDCGFGWESVEEVDKKEWDTVDGSEIRLYHQLRLAW